MLIRRECLDRTGLLDEDFFMYGEDIDLSYRLLKTGFHNYYFPETKIVHFKGRSTPRDNYNDILYFYDAMKIYVRKRANENGSYPWHYFIIAAIYFREALAILIRFINLRR